jgi:hypothetical protein
MCASSNWEELFPSQKNENALRGLTCRSQKFAALSLSKNKIGKCAVLTTVTVLCIVKFHY